MPPADTGTRATQEKRRATWRVRDLWKQSAERYQEAARKEVDPTAVALDAALKCEPTKRTAEQLDLLAAWVSSLSISASVRRTLDVDALCRTMMLSQAAMAAEQVVVAQGDPADTMYIVYQGGCAAYSVAVNAEGVAYTGSEDDGEGGGIPRESVLRQLAKKRNRESSVKATRGIGSACVSRFRRMPAPWKQVLARISAPSPAELRSLRKRTSFQPPAAKAKPRKHSLGAHAPHLTPPPTALPVAPSAAIAETVPPPSPTRARRVYPGAGERTRADAVSGRLLDGGGAEASEQLRRVHSFKLRAGRPVRRVSGPLIQPHGTDHRG